MVYNKILSFQKIIKNKNEIKKSINIYFKVILFKTNSYLKKNYQNI